MSKYLTHYEKTILDNIDLEAYDLNNEVSTYDKIKTTYNIFKEEYGHEIVRQRGDEVKAFKEWLMGLPSVLTVPFYNHNIIKNAEKAGFNLMTDEVENNFLEMYWHNLSVAFFTLKDNL